MRFRIGESLDAAAIHSLANEHPRLSSFIRNVARGSEEGDAHSRALLEHVVRRVVDDLGDMHMGKVMRSLENIETMRNSIAAILDHVLEGGDLPPGVSVDNLGELFNHLQSEMRELSKPRDALMGTGKLKLTDDPLGYATDTLKDFEQGGGAAHSEPTGQMSAAFKSLSDARKSAMKLAAGLDNGKLLWKALSSDEAGQTRALAELHSKLAGQMSADELADLDAAVREVSRSRSTALQVPADSLAAALEKIANPDLRSLVAGSSDVWYIQQLAIRSPEMLTQMWEAFRKKGGGAADHAGFRAYLRREMSTLRSLPGEYTAAFALGGGTVAKGAVPMDVDFFLKVPDDNPRAGGTDMLAMLKDGSIAIIDDKSHRASTVSSVTALFENLTQNMRDDAAQIRETVRRLKAEDPNYTPDPRVLPGADRLDSAARDIDAALAGVREADRTSKPVLGYLKSILDANQIDLRITSAFGEVQDVSESLRNLGIQVQSTGPLVTLPKPGGN